ncbi:MAG: radical SAM protein [Lachnospiraceae bacterium]|nr:radical SAM protein [Lachnospiraceae bacterium]
MSRAITRDELFRELDLDNSIQNDGVYFSPQVLKTIDFKNKYQEQIRGCFDMNHETFTALSLPTQIRLSSNYRIRVAYRHNAPYHVELEDGHYVLYKGKEYLDEVTFIEKPQWYDRRTSDGVLMKTIAQEVGKTKLTVAYSNECALKDKGLDCKFCNINATKRNFADLQGIEWKTAEQIAETYQAAYTEGYRAMTITGGFIPERREVDYYIDVAEAIHDAIDADDFGITACIGAPQDLDIIDKYKEAGYTGISSNMEIWDANIFKAICPGKEQVCGGRQNWINALKHEVEVFGKGNVRSFFVAGIEPKSSLLDGLEYLASIGVVPIPLHWIPNPGSELEGHRAPTPEWFLDLDLKAYSILKQHGFTHRDLFASANVENSIFDYLFDLDGDHLDNERHNSDTIQFKTDASVAV